MREIWPKIYIGLHLKYPLFLYDFNETWVFSIGFRKYPNIKFNENRPSERRVFLRLLTDEQTDRHDEANSHFSQFCEPAQNNYHLQ
jgi:hypothetical protein